jgi:hypothetical protein
MKYFTIIPLLILSFCNGFSQTRKLTPAQEDSIVRVIDQWLFKLQKTPPSYWPTNEFLTKHRKTMLLGDQLIFCSADENSKGEIESYGICMINLKYVYLNYSISRYYLRGNIDCTIRNKSFFPKKKDTKYNEDIFADTTRFADWKYMCKDEDRYYALALKTDFSDEHDLHEAIKALAMSHGGGERRVLKLDREKSFLGFTFNEDRSYFDPILIKGTAKKGDKVTFEQVDTSKNTGLREFFGARVKNIFLGFNEKNKLNYILIYYYNNGFQSSTVRKKLTESFGEDTDLFGVNNKWYNYRWQGQVLTIDLLTDCLDNKSKLQDEKNDCNKIVIYEAGDQNP